MKKICRNTIVKNLAKDLLSLQFRGGATLKALSIAALVGLTSISVQPAGAEVAVKPVLDNFHDSDKKIPNTETVYPASEYTLTEVTPADVNNLPINVIKYYDPNNLDNEVHYFEIGFKNAQYGEGDTAKYFKWAKDGDSVKLVETSNEADAVLTIKYDSSALAPDKVYADGATIASVSEIYVGKDIKGLIGSKSRIENISSKFVGSTSNINSSDDYNSSVIYTEAGKAIGSVTSSFIGNNITVDSNGGLIHGTLIKALGSIDEVSSEFIGNTVSANANIFGGLVEAQSAGTIGKVTSDFIRNTVTSSASIRGAVVRNDGKMTITSSKFVENAGISTGDKAYGGAIENSGTTNGKGMTVTDTVFTGNRVISATSEAYGGAIKNSGTLRIENSTFKDNFAQSPSGSAKGGAIFTDVDLTIAANNGKTTEFTDNYTLNGATKENQAIYVNSDLATVTFDATSNGTILLNDVVDGVSGYNVVLNGDETGTIKLYNSILNADVTANGGNINTADNKIFNYNFLSLNSTEGAKYTIDVDFANQKADKFTLGAESRGTIYISDLNLIGTAPTTTKVIQVLTAPDTISIALTQDAIDKFHKITVRDRGESDELTSSAKWGTTFGAHLYKDTIEEGLRTAVSGSGRTSADALEYYVNTTTEDMGVVAAGDTMMLMNQSDKFSSKTFSANSSSDTYTVGANLGKTSGIFTVSGYSSSGKNTLDANGHTLFEVGAGAQVNLNYLTINNLADSEGSLLNIKQYGSAALNNVNFNGNDSTTYIVNDGNLTLSGGSSSAHNTIAGGGIKGSGTTTISSRNDYWDIAASGVQNTVNNGNLYLNSGTLNSTISGNGYTYINNNSTVTTNANNLRTIVSGYSDDPRSTNQVLNLTGGEINSQIYSVTMNITGDVTVGERGKIGYDDYDTNINISDGASLTTNVSKFDIYKNALKLTNEGDLNLTGGEYMQYQSNKSSTISGSGTINILGNVDMHAYHDYEQPAIYNNIHVKNGTLTIHPDSIHNNIINDSILYLTTNTSESGGNLGSHITELNGTGKTIISGAVRAYYTNFNQDVQINSGGRLYTNWNKNFTNILNNGTLIVTNNGTTSDRTSSSSHGVWSQAVQGGTIKFSGGSLYLDNQAQLDNTIVIERGYIWSNADLLGGLTYIGTSGASGHLTLTGGTINNKITGRGNYDTLYIDTGINIISNAIISSTSTSTGTYRFLQLKDNSTLTISADNLDANTYLNSGSNLKLKTGTWDDEVGGSGTVTILSDNNVEHTAGKTVAPAVVVEDNATFTASATDLKGAVTNDGDLYLSGLLSRQYNGTGTTYIDEELHVASGAGFPATFDLNNGTLVSDAVNSYTFGHTTNSGNLIFNINAGNGTSDNFTLASTSDAVFNINDIMFGTYTSASFANTEKTYQILKGSPSYLTLGETIQKDVAIHNSYDDQLGVNIYQSDPANRYFDDPYNTHHISGTVGATIELATTDNNHDSVKVTYGDYVSNDYTTRLDLLSDWNQYYTTKEKNFNFRTANDVYTSIQDVGTISGKKLNINGVSTTTTDADGNTVVNRSVIDLAGHDGFEVNSTSVTMNISNTEFRNGGGRYFSVKGIKFGEQLSDGSIKGGIVNCLFGNTTGYAFHIGKDAVVYQIKDSIFTGNTRTAIYNYSGTIKNIIDTTFTGNSADSIYNYTGTIENITGSTFKDNSSPSIENMRIITNIANSTFENNSDYSILNNKEISNITGSTFTKNSAYSIYNKSYRTISNITGSTFTDNSSSSIRNEGTIYNITNSTFVEGSSNSTIYNEGTISYIIDSIFEGNKGNSSGGAIYNYGGTIGEIVNSTFKNNHASNNGGAIYNSGTMKITARGSVDGDGNITEGLTEFTGNYQGSELTDSNNYAIYNNETLTLSAENHGTILMNDKITNPYGGKLNLTGDSTGTIKLFDTVKYGVVSASGANISTANSKTQYYTFSNFSSDETAKWTIDVDFANNASDTFNVGTGTGTMYIDNLNILGNADKYTKVKVLNKSQADTTELKLNGENINVVTDIRDTIGDTVYNDETYHQDAGYAVISSTATYKNDSISQCIDEDLDQLALITESNNNEVRNFIFRDGGTHTVKADIGKMGAGTLNIIGLAGDTITSTIDANGHSLFIIPGESVVNISNTKIINSPYIETQAYYDVALNLENVIIDGNIQGWRESKINISGRETSLLGTVSDSTVTLNSGNLIINPETFNTFRISSGPEPVESSVNELMLNGGKLTLDNGAVETYTLCNFRSVADAKLSIDLDLASKTSDKMDIQSSTGTVTLSGINFLNTAEQDESYIIQVLKSNSSLYPDLDPDAPLDDSTSEALQLALDESIKRTVLKEYSKYQDDVVQVDTNFGDEFYNRLYTGTMSANLELATTSTTNDSIKVNIVSAWNEETTPIEKLGDTLDMVNNADLTTRNFNSSNANDNYNLSVDLSQTAAGTLNLNGTLDNDTRSTINFKNHDAFQIGDGTTLSVNNIRLTGAKDAITVNSANADVILNNAYINGNIVGNERFDLLLNGLDTTTINGKITNADVEFANGGLVIAENTFADESVTLNVNEGATVYFNDGDISNYNFSNINSSILSKYGMDIDLSERTADTITAEGSGKIVLEEFNIVNNISGLTLDDKTQYTIQILKTSGDRSQADLQLAISETIKSQLSDEYKLGSVHEIVSTDVINPTSNWKDRYYQNMEDYDVFGKLDLATTETLNDSLYLYDFKKNLVGTRRILGDTLKLLSILDTDSDRHFVFDTASDRYLLTDDIGKVTDGSLSIEGVTAESGHSVIDMQNHKGFQLDKQTQMSVSDVTFENAGYKDGSLVKITNADAVLNLANATITGTTSTNAIVNDGTVNATGGDVILYSGITGAGITNVENGASLEMRDGMSLTQSQVNVNNGSLLLNADSYIFGDLTVGASGIATMATSGITSDAVNNGHIVFTGGTLVQNITGTGTTDITGTVVNNAKISQNVDVQSGEFTTSADNITGVINNNAVTNLTGTLKNVVTGTGVTNVNESLTLAAGAGIEGTLDLNSGAISTADRTITDYTIGTMLNEGNFAIDLDLTSKTADKFIVGNNSQGTVTLDSIDFLNPTEEMSGFKVQVLETHGTDAIQLALSEALTGSPIAVKELSNYRNDLKATVNYDEKFSDYTQNGVIYATVQLATTNTTNDSIELAFTTEWDDETAVQRADTLKELAQWTPDVETEKNFNFKTSADTYEVSEDLGAPTSGTLNVNGVADGDNRSEIAMSGHSGFELDNETTLNLTDVEIGGAKNDTIISATNADAVVNITNNTLNGNIEGAGNAINITGDETDTTTLNGTITNADTTLTGGTLKFNTDTFADSQDTLDVVSGRVDVQDSAASTYEINKLTSGEDARYSIDVDWTNNNSDKLKVTDNTSGGTVYIDNINYIASDPTKEFKAQVLETSGDLQIQLSEALKSQEYALGTEEKDWNDLAASIDFDKKFHNLHQEGTILGTIKESTTETTNDSIELSADRTAWGEIQSTDRGDALHDLAANYELKAGETQKDFNFKTSTDEYKSTEDVGVVTSGLLNINGVADGANRSKLNLNGHKGFELAHVTTLKITNAELLKGADGTLIKVTNKDAVIALINDTLNGNIQGAGNAVNITGSETDVTTLNGTITNAKTTLTGGTLKFNTNTFADSQDTLDVVTGRVDVKDNHVDNYNVQKLTSNVDGRYGIDVDLGTKTGDKFVVSDQTSSGTIYIDDIQYLNSNFENEFKVQVLDTKGNSNLQIRLANTLKGGSYELGKTYKYWDDLKATIAFDESYHDYTLEGTLIGSIKEGTTATTNDSIELSIDTDRTRWDDVSDATSIARQDTLHELAQYELKEGETQKDFNFKTANDTYISKADVGTLTADTFNVNGIADGDERSEIAMSGHSGFELDNETTLNLTDVEIGGAKNDTIISATNADAVVNITNNTLNGNIEGAGNAINITGDDSDTTTLNGTITNADTTFNGGTLKFNTDTFADEQDTLDVQSGRVDVKDSRIDNYDVQKLTSSQDAKYSIDIDLSAKTADKLNVTDTTSSGTVYIDTINYINGELPVDFKTQVLDTNGNENLQIQLSEDIKSGRYNIGTTSEDENDLKASVSYDEKFHDSHRDGILKGSIKEATTETTNDSIELSYTETEWGEWTTTERKDTLKELTQYTLKEDETQKDFNFKTANDNYTVEEDLGKATDGIFNINGKSDGDNRSEIAMNGHSGFELDNETTLNLTDLEIGGAKNDTIISATNADAVINIENNTLNGNIKGAGNAVNITGDETDTTTLNGTITNADTTFNGGTLKFNTDTFADEQDTLNVQSGRVDVKDSQIDTYDVNSLTSSEDAKYSIDIDLTAQTADKLNVTETASSGTVYIDTINYINGSLPTEFTAQVLETHGNENLQIKLSDEIKETVYDLGNTEENWNDLKADVDYDELFHDYHRDGVMQGSIKEATTKTENDSIALQVDNIDWGETEVKDRIDTLHEISDYEAETDKTFNFKTSEDVFTSKQDVGELNGTLSINGVKDKNGMSTIDLAEHKGFELIENSKLKVNSTRLINGAEDIVITAKDSSAEITLNNSQAEGVITGEKGYTLNLTGDAAHVYDIRSDIENAKVNVNTIKLDVYNTEALKTSDVTMNSGILNMTSDERVSDLASNTFTINGTFKMLADADLRNQTMDKLPANTTIADKAMLDVAGINLLSDTTNNSVAIPFAYKGFKDNVKYTGGKELSKETQITTAYAPIYKYDIRYDNRDDMGYFVFSRQTAGGGTNPSEAYNPAILASPVATQAAGQSAMNETFRYVFEHADAFTQLPAIDRIFQIKSNQYALSTDFNHNLGSLCPEHNNKAGWFRPYTSFESLNLSNGPKVSTINYGSLVGYDTDFRHLKNGWHNVGTGYIGYNGSQLHYSGVDTTMNGGLVGLTETFYKGNFWTALTATAGAGVAETRTMYGKEDSTMLMAGIGSKTGYNFEFKEGKYILQPIMFMSYTFVNTFDYTNAAGVRIQNDPMHTIQLNPSVRFISNLKGGWQPYAQVGMVWNLLNEANSAANGVKLPEMHTKPYVEYGVGIQKLMKDKFTAFGQAMLRNGGRTGIALTFGFRWALGEEHPHKHEQVKAPETVKTSHNRTILKQLPREYKTSLTNAQAIVKHVE